MAVSCTQRLPAIGVSTAIAVMWSDFFCVVSSFLFVSANLFNALVVFFNDFFFTNE